MLSSVEGQIIQMASSAFAPIVTGNLALGSVETALKVTGDRIVAAADNVPKLAEARKQAALPQGRQEVTPPVPLDLPSSVKVKELVEVEVQRQEPLANRSAKPVPVEVVKSAEPSTKNLGAKADDRLGAALERIRRPAEPKGGAIAGAVGAANLEQIVQDQAKRLDFVAGTLKVAASFSKSQPKTSANNVKAQEAILENSIKEINKAFGLLAPGERTGEEGKELRALASRAANLLKQAQSARSKQKTKAVSVEPTVAEVKREIEALGTLFRDQLKGSISSSGDSDTDKKIRAEFAQAVLAAAEDAEKLIKQLQTQLAILETGNPDAKRNQSSGNRKAASALSNVTRSKSEAQKAIKEAERSGIEFAGGYSQGIELGIERSLQVVALLANKSVSELRDELEIRSPSKLTREIGEFFTEGYAKGISKISNLQIAKLLSPSLEDAESLTKQALAGIEQQFDRLSPNRLLKAARSEKGQALLKDLAVNTTGFVASQVGGNAGPVGALAGDLVGALAARMAIVTGEAIQAGFKQLQGTNEFESATQIEKSAMLFEAAAKEFRQGAIALGKDLTGDLSGFAIGNAAAGVIGLPLSGAAVAMATVPKVQKSRDRFAGSDAGENFADSFSDQVSDGTRDAAQAARALGRAAEDGLEAELQIASPSKVASRIGLFFVQGFEEAIAGLRRIDISGILSPALELTEQRVRQSRQRIEDELRQINARAFDQSGNLSANSPRGRDNNPRGSANVSGRRAARIAETLSALESEIADPIKNKIDEIEKEIELKSINPKVKVDLDLVEPLENSNPQLRNIESRVQIDRDRDIDLSELPEKSIKSYSDFQAKAARIEADLDRQGERLDKAIADIATPKGETLKDRIERLFKVSINSNQLFGQLKSIAAAAVGFYGLDSVFDSIKFKAQEVVVNFVELDRSLKTFAVVAQASAKDAGAVRSEVERLALVTPKTAKEIAEVSVELAKAGFNAKQVAGILPAVVNSSVATGESLQTTGEVIGATLGQFGLFSDNIEQTQRNATNVSDLLTAASNASATGVTELGESLKYAASQAKLNNQSSKETITNLALLAAAGTKGSSAGTGLAEALRRISFASAASTTELDGLVGRGSKQAVAAFETLKLSVRDASGAMLPLQEIIPDLKKSLVGFAQGDKELILRALFGVQGGNAIGKLLNLTDAQVAQVAEQMDAFAGASDRAAESMQQGFSGAIDQFTSSATQAGLVLGELIGAGLEPLVRVSTQAINALLNIPEPIRNGALALLALTTASTIATGAIAAYNLLNGQLIVNETLAAAAMLRRAVTTGLATGATAKLTAVNALLNKQLFTLSLAGTVDFFKNLAGGAIAAAKALATINVSTLFSSGTKAVGDFAGALLGATKQAETFGALSLPVTGKAAAAGGAVRALVPAFTAAAAAAVVFANIDIIKNIRDAGKESRQITADIKKNILETETAIADLRANQGKTPLTEFKDPTESAREGLTGFGKFFNNRVLEPVGAFNSSLNRAVGLDENFLGITTVAQSAARQQARDFAGAVEQIDAERAKLTARRTSGEEIDVGERDLLIGSIDENISALSRLQPKTKEQLSARRESINLLKAERKELESLGQKALDTSKSLRQVSTEDLTNRRDSNLGAAADTEKQALLSISRQELRGKIDKEDVEEAKLKATRDRLKAEQVAQQQLLRGLKEKGPSDSEEDEEARQAALKESYAAILALDQELADNQIQSQSLSNQRALDSIQERTDKELGILTRGAGQRDLLISRSLERGSLTQEQADDQRLKLSQERIASEISLERDRLAQLQEQGPLTGEAEDARLEQVESTEQKITDLENQASQERLQARKDANQRALEQISGAAERQIDAATAAELSKQLEISQIEEQGGINQEEVERRKSQATRDRIAGELQAERQRLKQLQGTKLTGEEETQRLEQIRDTEGKITQLQIQAIEERNSLESQQLTNAEQRAAKQASIAASAEARKQLEIAQLLDQGIIDQEEAERRKNQSTLDRIAADLAAERQKLLDLQALQLTGAEEVERIDAVRAAQEAIAQLELQSLEERSNQRIQSVQAFAEAELQAITSAEAQKQLEIARLQESGTISSEEAENRKKQAATDRIASEIQLERDRLNQLEAVQLVGDAEEQRVDAARQSQERITALELEAIEDRRARVAEVEQQQLDNLKKSQEDALIVFEDAATERQILQQRLINEARKGGVSEAELAKFLAETEVATKFESIQQRLDAERQYLADLEALPQPNSPEVAQAREAEIRDARRQTSGLVLELLKAEEEEQKRIHQQAIDQINEQINARKTELDNLKAIATAAVSNEQSLISARQRLAQSQLALTESGLQQRIDAAKTEEEKQRLQIALEKQRAIAVAERLELEKQAFELSQQKALLDAEIEITERQIALEEAIANGETERQIELKRKLLGLAEGQLDVLKESQDIEAEALSNEQKLAKQQAQQAIDKVKEDKEKDGKTKLSNPRRRNIVSGRGGDGTLVARRQPFDTSANRIPQEVARAALGIGPRDESTEAQKQFYEIGQIAIPSLAQQLGLNSERLAQVAEALLRPTMLEQLGGLTSQAIGLRSPESEQASTQQIDESIAKAAADEDARRKAERRATADEEAAQAVRGFITNLDGLRAFANQPQGDLVRLNGNPRIKNLFTGGPLGAGETATLAEHGPELVQFDNGGMALVQDPGLFRSTQNAQVYDAIATAKMMNSAQRVTPHKATYVQSAGAAIAPGQLSEAMLEEMRAMHKDMGKLLAQIAKQGKPSPFSKGNSGNAKGGDTILFF
ncbi:MAG: phage tail tape measure protein [Synechococcales cyanobacterium CRU_2_2]|nr:phage tail tape measure protein [Synechococcales cyanobacterium CRU_2_2]